MAKATAICTCKECGKEFTKEATKRNRKEADSWEEWAEANFDLCPQCWGKQQREKERQEPPTLEVNLLPYSVECPVMLTWTGNSYPIKETLKKQGYRFDFPESPGFWGMIGINRPRKIWVKYVSLDKLETVLVEEP